MIAIIDYGVGNLFSLKCSIDAVGHEAVVTRDTKIISDADKILLPGVGAYEDAARRLRETGMAQVVLEQTARGKPLLGICLGMQLLFETSYEYGEHKGLGLIPGNVKPISDVIDPELKIPHIGWNPLIFRKPSRLYRDIREGDCVYFVHSYYAADCAPYVTAEAEYSAMLTASVEKDNIYGLQYHPEKSGETGMKILKAFCDL